VQYNVAGFLDKNRDTLFLDLKALLQSSTSAFIRELFPEEMVRHSSLFLSSHKYIILSLSLSTLNSLLSLFLYVYI
jgi:myosin heavy subunit